MGRTAWGLGHRRGEGPTCPPGVTPAKRSLGLSQLPSLCPFVDLCLSASLLLPVPLPLCPSLCFPVSGLGCSHISLPLSSSSPPPQALQGARGRDLSECPAPGHEEPLGAGEDSPQPPGHNDLRTSADTPAPPRDGSEAAGPCGLGPAAALSGQCYLAVNSQRVEFPGSQRLAQPLLECRLGESVVWLCPSARGPRQPW